MKIESSLGLRYLSKNKKRSISIIFGIVIVTILVTTVLTLLSSYQDYLASSVRNKRNWEAEFKNVTYKEALKIADNENVREVSIRCNMGVSEEVFGELKEKGYNYFYNVQAFDENTFKNGHITLKEGRLPVNSKEIIVNDAYANIDDKINVTLNGETFEYMIVGKMERTSFDQSGFLSITQKMAITYLDDEMINDDLIVDASIITNNIQKIYKTGSSLEESLSIQNKEEDLTPEMEELKVLQTVLHGEEDDGERKLEYNEKLLNYECVIEGNNEFAKTLITVFGFAIGIIAIVSIVMIYTSFKMTYWDRIKELGMLSSIGMSKKQKRGMLNAETRVLGAIGIAIGIAIGLGVAYIIIKIVGNLLETVNYSSFLTVVNNAELSLKVPVFVIILSVLIVWIIVKISSLLPMKKIDKISPIEAIRNTLNIKITEKQVKHPKVIEKIFKEEGILAYKNIRRDKSKYKTIVISLTISLVLFLSVNGFVANLDVGKTEVSPDYQLSIMSKNQDTTKIEKITNYLEDNNLMNSYYGYQQILNPEILRLEEDKISDTLKQMISDGLYEDCVSEGGRINVTTFSYLFLGDSYDEILRKAGVKELKSDEIIIANYINEKTKYGDKIRLTNFNIGDEITLKLGAINIAGVGSVGGIEKTFKIAGIVEDFSPYIGSTYNKGNNIIVYQLINPDTAEEIYNANKESEYNTIYTTVYLSTDEERAEIIDSSIEKLNEIIGKDGTLTGINLIPNKKSEANDRLTLEILLYSFVGLALFISAINVFNTIYASTIMRKREFESLKSIGMTDKQIKKMTFLEGIFYGLDSIMFGVIISIVILYVMYILMIETRVYLFSVPWTSIFGSIIAIYIVIFFAIFCARRKLKNTNIIDEIRGKNV